MRQKAAIIFIVTILLTGCSKNENDRSPDKNNTSTSTKATKIKLDKEETQQEDIQEKIIKENKIHKSKKKILSSNKKSIFIDVDTKLMWQDNKDSKTLYKNWKDAKDYCSNLTIGTYSDWRLPSYKELLSIVDYKKYDPAIKNGFEFVSPYYYWSSSEKPSYRSEAWLVNFENGYTFTTHKSNKNHVRCVRNNIN